MVTPQPKHTQAKNLADAQKLEHVKAGSYADKNLQMNQQANAETQNDASIGNHAELQNPALRKISLAFLIEHMKGNVTIAIKAKSGDLNAVKFNQISPSIKIDLDESGNLILRGDALQAYKMLQSMLINLPESSSSAFDISVLQNATMVLKTSLVFYAEPGNSKGYKIFADNKSATNIDYSHHEITFIDSDAGVFEKDTFNSKNFFSLVENSPLTFEVSAKTDVTPLNILFPQDTVATAPTSNSTPPDSPTTDVGFSNPVSQTPPVVEPQSPPVTTSTPPPSVAPSPTNSAPVASDFTRNGNEDVTVSFALANFTAAYADSEGDALVSITIQTLPLNGDLKLSGVNITAGQVIVAANITNITFVPNANWNGSTTFDWSANDGNADSNVKTVTLTLTGSNDAPDAVNDAVAVNEDATSGNLVATLLGNDTDPDAADTKSITAVDTTGTVGTVTFNAGTQTLTFAANNNAHDALNVGDTATTSFTYTMSDASGTTDTATVTMTINGVNDAPVVATALTDQYLLASGAVNYQFAAGSFTDIDAGDTLTYTAEYWNGTAWAALPAWLTFTPGTRTFSAAAGTAVLGLYETRVTATDSHGASVSDIFELGLGDVIGTANEDRLYGNVNNNVIFALASHDTVSGYAGDDIIYGQAGNGRLLGGTGNDTLNGSTSNDNLFGGEGADILFSGDGHDYFYYISFTDSTTTNTDIIRDFNITNDSILVVGFTGIGTAAPVGTVLQRSFDGTYTLITGANGFQIKILGDYLSTIAGRILYRSTYGTGGDDTLTGTTGVDGILAGAGNDVINADADHDIIYAEDGNDTINGGVGADTITGGAGSDVFVYDMVYVSPTYNFQSDSVSFDTITDFTHGVDKIDLSSLPIAGMVSGAATIDNVGVTYDAARDITIVQWHADTARSGTGVLTIHLEGNIALDAGDFIFNTTLYTAGAEVINGTAGNDRIAAMGGNDTISLGDGNDRLTASGNNYINLGNGDNISWSSTGNDTIIGGSGIDYIIDTGGTNYIFTRGGNDYVGTVVLYTRIGTVFLGSGDDSISVASGTFYGGDGNDNLSGGNSGTGNDDLLYGEAGNDQLTGVAGSDTLYGGNGSDSLYGGGGNDSLYGGYGADSIYGGNFSGASQQDTIGYNDINESTLTERDTIVNFAVGSGATSGKILIYGFTGIAQGAASGLTLGFTHAAGTTTISSSAGYSFSINLAGDYTSTGTPFDIPNDFEFRPGILGTMGADNAGAFATTSGYDHVMGLEGNDTINAGSGDDSVFGGHDNDELNGEDGNDSINGGYGTDTINGGAGEDTLEGSTGGDIFRFTNLTHSTSAAGDVINDFLHNADADKIDLTGLGITGFGGGAAELTVSYSNQFTLISHNASTFQVKLLGYYEFGVDFFATDFIF